MIFKTNRRLLSEAATADLLDPEVSDEVKDTVDELEDVLSNNVEEVKPEDKTTNGGIPVTTESVALMRANGKYRNSNIKYLVKLEDVIAIKEAEGEEKAAEQMDEPDTKPSEADVEANEPDAASVIDDIAKKNGVEPDQVAVVISSECAFLAETAILESKCGKKKGKGKKKLKKTLDTVKELEGKVAMVKA